MAFNYIGDLSTDRDLVRFWISDTVSGSGPRPGDSNLTDAEVDALITLEGSWQRAVAGAFEMLAAAWANQPNIKIDEFSESRSDVAKSYSEKAAQWRKRHGSSTSSISANAVTRVDGYSDDVAADAT